jgi:acetyltransferase AlgX (SGNH hydrolase-like protein)
MRAFNASVIRRLGTNLAVLLVSCCIFLIAGEIVVRALGIKPRPGPYDPNQVDRDLGMVPIPSQALKADFPEYSGTLILQTNNLGFYQSKDTAPEPAAGTERIAVLGDSFTAGASNARENFPTVLEDILNAKQPGHPVEVLDVGAGRYAPYHSYVRFRRDILKLKPKHVIVAEYVGNDFLDMIRQDDRPYLRIKPDGTMVPEPPRFITYPDPSARPGLLDHSRLYSVLVALAGPTIRYEYSRVVLLRDNLKEYGYGTRAILKYILEIAKLDKIAHGMMLQILNQQVWFDHFPETLPLSLKVNRESMRLFRDLCQQQGIRLTYTIIPSEEMIEPELMNEVYSQLRESAPQWTPERMAAFDNRLTDETLRACQDYGVECIDLRPGLRKRHTTERMYYPQDMHMNPVGNRAVAEVLAEALLSSR